LPKDVHHIVGDRKEREKFETTMRQYRFDAVIDMICYSAEDAASSIRAFADNTDHFVQISTTCTYGVDYNWLPASEDHPLRPISDYGRRKVAAERLYLAAHYQDGFPVTIVRPSTTYGPVKGMLRQIAKDFSWLDRVRKGKPIAICGDGKALHQFLHVDDAAMGLVGMLGKPHCIGQTYNLVNRGYTTWEEYHRLAMKVLGNEVELVGITLRDLTVIDELKFAPCIQIFAHNCYYSSEKLFRDVPEFVPAISLEEGMLQVIAELDKAGRVPDSDLETWEDDLIRAQKQVREVRL
jgi:nucleoside-diphosphate-sugar epimerase